MKFAPGDKVVQFTDNGHGQMKFGEVVCSKPNEDLAVCWEGYDENEPVPPDSEINNIWIYDRPLNLGDRVCHLGLNGSVCASRKLVTVRLLSQHHVHISHEGDKEFTTHSNYDPSPDYHTILPIVKDNVLQPVLAFQIGDNVMHAGWAGVVTGGDVSVIYRFENGGNMRLKNVRSLETMSNPSIYVGLKVGQLGSFMLTSGSWSRGFRPYNRINYRRRPAIVASVDILSVDVMWLERIRPLEAGHGDISEIGSQSPPSKLKGKSVLSTVFSFSDPSQNKFMAGSIFTVRWGNVNHDDAKNWRESFIQEMCGNEICTSEVHDQPSYKRSKPNIEFSSRDWVAVRVLFHQTLLDILFDDNCIQKAIPSWRILERLPHPRKAMLEIPYPDICYELGDVVKDLIDFQHTHLTKYGFVLRTNYTKRTVDVSWVTIFEQGGSARRIQLDLKEMSQYDIQPVNCFLWLKMRPQIVVAKGVFEGVILGLNIPQAKIIVQCAEGPVKQFYLHELTFLQKKVYYSRATKTFEASDLEMQPDIIPFANYCKPSMLSASLRKDDAIFEKYRFFTSVNVPEDHTFFSIPSQFPAQSLNDLNNLTIFGGYVEREIQVLREAVMSSADAEEDPPSVFVERVGSGTGRWDLLTIAVIGAKGIYQDIPFFLDIHLPFWFWEWGINHNPALRPKIVVRLPRVYFPNWIHPSIAMEDSSLTYPNEFLYSWKAACDQSEEVIGFLSRVVHYFSRNVLCEEPQLQQGEDQMVRLGLGRRRIGIPIHPDSLQENNNNTDSFAAEHTFTKYQIEKSRNFNETAWIALLDNIHSQLCCPPSSWKKFVECHFYNGLPRIYKRVTELLKMQCTHRVNTQKHSDDIENAIQEIDVFLLNRTLGSKYLIYPISHSFTLAMENRLKLIQPFLDAASIRQ